MKKLHTKSGKGNENEMRQLGAEQSKERDGEREKEKGRGEQRNRDDIWEEKGKRGDKARGIPSSSFPST